MKCWPSLEITIALGDADTIIKPNPLIHFSFLTKEDGLCLPLL